jgi:hypothetical protein
MQWDDTIYYDKARQGKNPMLCNVLAGRRWLRSEFKKLWRYICILHPMQIRVSIFWRLDTHAGYYPALPIAWVPPSLKIRFKTLFAEDYLRFWPHGIKTSNPTS